MGDSSAGDGGDSATAGSTSSGGSASSGGSSNSGGTSNDGGTANSGGSSSTGGSANDGGSSSTGGSSNSGGTPSTGGTSSDGGTSNSAGTSSTGGTSSDGGTSNSGGSAGHGGSGGAPDCASLLDVVSTTQAAAQACNPASTKPQPECQGSLPGVCCPIGVESASETDPKNAAYLSALDAYNASCPHICPAIACFTPQVGDCKVASASSGKCGP